MLRLSLSELNGVIVSELFGVSCLAWMSSPDYRKSPGSWLWCGLGSFSRIWSKAVIYGRWPPRQKSAILAQRIEKIKLATFAGW
jgi:hypothetical protein